MTLGRSGTTSIEFAIVAPVLIMLLFGGIEYSRMMWTWQALQLTGDQTARCVAIGGTACASPASYAVTTAKGYGLSSLAVTGVVVDTQSAASSPVVCALPTGNTASHVKLSLSFTSPMYVIIPALAKTLTTHSCFPLTGL